MEERGELKLIPIKVSRKKHDDVSDFLTGKPSISGRVRINYLGTDGSDIRKKSKKEATNFMNACRADLINAITELILKVSIDEIKTEALHLDEVDIATTAHVDRPLILIPPDRLEWFLRNKDVWSTCNSI